MAISASLLKTRRCSARLRRWVSLSSSVPTDSSRAVALSSFTVCSASVSRASMSLSTLVWRVPRPERHPHQGVEEDQAEASAERRDQRGPPGDGEGEAGVDEPSATSSAQISATYR